MNSRSLSPTSTFDVYNSVTHACIATLTNATGNDIEAAISAATVRYHTPSTGHARQQMLIALHDQLTEHRHELATIISKESGKTLGDAMAEIDYANQYLSWFAQLAQSMDAPIEVAEKVEVWREPAGVVGAITPWNFPCAMIVRKLAAAIAAGCPFVVKPSELTPLSALKIAEYTQNAGWDKGWLAVLVSDQNAAVGQILTTDPRIAKFTFTGSTRVGKLLSAQCASSLKRVSLELGGNAPMLVFGDADIELAVAQCVANKQRGTGQTCVAVNRIYVAASVAEAFTQALVARVSGLTTGDPLHPDTQVGHMITFDAANTTHNRVQQAIAQGAQVLCGGVYQAGSAYYPHTVLTRVQHDDDVVCEEIFGPLYPIITIDDTGLSNDAVMEQMLKYANDTQAGLASYVFSADNEVLVQCQRQLQYGMVGCNTAVLGNAAAPFGGIKQSGFGREGGSLGLDDFTYLKYIKPNA